MGNHEANASTPSDDAPTCNEAYAQFLGKSIAPLWETLNDCFSTRAGLAGTELVSSNEDNYDENKQQFINGSDYGSSVDSYSDDAEDSESHKPEVDMTQKREQRRERRRQRCRRDKKANEVDARDRGLVILGGVKKPERPADRIAASLENLGSTMVASINRIVDVEVAAKSSSLSSKPTESSASASLELAIDKIKHDLEKQKELNVRIVEQQKIQNTRVETMLGSINLNMLQSNEKKQE